MLPGDPHCPPGTELGLSGEVVLRLDQEMLAV